MERADKRKRTRAVVAPKSGKAPRKRPAKRPRKLECVVTYLEMREPSHHANILPAGHKIALLRAERPPLSFYRYLYNTVGERWLWWERRAMADAALAAIIHDPKVEILVLYVDGVPAGYAELDGRVEDEIELAYFGLVPEFQGRALGPYLLGCALEEAWLRAPDRVWVHTCNLDHPKAFAIYQRAGFAPYRQETRMIDDPRDTGLIPKSVKLPKTVRP